MTRNKHRQSGFSLTEMLLATGIMAIGLVMIATIFPVGVKLTGMSAERSIAAVAANEAFAKIRLYGMRDFVLWPTTEPNAVCTDYRYTTAYAGPDGFLDTFDDNYMQPGPDGSFGTADDISWDTEFQYPSTTLPSNETYRYHWSALCRQTGDKDVQVTVFVTSRTYNGLNYYELPWDGAAFVPGNTGSWPTPVPVNVQYNSANPRELVILTGSGSGNEDWNTSKTGEVLSFFDEGVAIVSNHDGRIYRIFEYTDVDGDGKRDIVLFDNWQPDPDNLTGGTIWVVPPGINSSRYPCVGVFQRVIHFENMN